MNNNENWKSAAKQISLKDIPGFENIYSISDKGDVWSIRQSKFLKPRLSQDGYNRVALCVNGKRYEHRVSRLVAITYLDNPENLPQVNHKDFNRLNNYIENLEWCTNSDNAYHAQLHGKREGTVRGLYKVYTFTNVYNSKSFSIIGFNNVLKMFNIKQCKHVFLRNANTGKYIKKGIFKGYRVDIENLEVQRLSQLGVDSNESKCETP